MLRPLLLLLGLLAAPAYAQQSDPPRALIIVIDGLRPDYITPETMPNLVALRQRGFFGADHHAVFPTVTRVNAPSLVTGAYPRTHGLMGNTMYVPHLRHERPLNTGDADDLRLLDAATDGALLTTPSLGEILQQHGKRLFVASSGSAGSAFLLNHRGAGLVHHTYVLPDTLAPLIDAVLGPAPAPGTPRLALVRRAVDAVLQVGLDRLKADVLLLWITEPDGTAHAQGVGAPPTVEALGEVDAEVGRLLAGLETRALRERTNVFVTADHGFSTHVGQQSLHALLVAQGLKHSNTSTDVVVAGGAIHVNEGGPARIEAIVRLLQQTAWVGPVFTRRQASDTPSTKTDTTAGSVVGTLSFSTIRWDHARAADLLVAGNWTADRNAYGYRGAVQVPGVAGHGSASPYDIRIPLIAAGPQIKIGIESEVPTGNVDLAPTVLHLLEVPLAEAMEGRVLEELLVGGPAPVEVAVVRQQARAEAVWEEGGYRLVLHRSWVGGTVYVDFAEVWRR